MIAHLTAHQERLAEDLGEKLANTVQQNLVAALANIEMDKENTAPYSQADAVKTDRTLLDIID